MSTAWLKYPLSFESSRAFECDSLDPEQCAFSRERWRFWYIADLVFALPTIVFFISTIGVFIIIHIAGYSLRIEAVRNNSILQRPLAFFRYASYRGFHVHLLRWHTAPVGLLLLGCAGAVFFFCMDLIPQPYYWSDEILGQSPPLSIRSGWMALACMPFVFATASKANWLTLFTGVSHERLQVFHRWIAYAFFILALMHTFPFVIYHTIFGDLEEVVTVTETFEYWTGIAALILQAWLTFASHSAIRVLGYEFFKTMHIVTMILFVIIFFWHCAGTLTSWDYFVATAVVYVPCLLYSFGRTYFKHGWRLDAKIVIESNGNLRIEVPGKFDWALGQHCFLSFTEFGTRAALTSHPFTICSMQPGSALLFYVQPKRGLTRKLYELAQKSAMGTAIIKVFIDGPYGGIDMSRFDDSDRVIIVAGGSGAGWCLPLITRFVETVSKAESLEAKTSGDKSQGPSGKDSGSMQAKERSLRIILSARDAETLKWFCKTIEATLSQFAERYGAGRLDINLHLTRDLEENFDRPLKTKEQEGKSDVIGSPDTITDTLLPGRPNLPLLLHEEAARASRSHSSIGVFECGPSSMQNDVRNAVARENLAIVKGAKSGPIYLHQEHFSWA